MFWTSLPGYGGMRLDLWSFRIDQQGHPWGLQQSQTTGVPVLLWFAVWVVNRARVRWMAPSQRTSASVTPERIEVWA